MTKEEKALVIENIAAQLGEYPHFYITDIEALNAEQTAQLRRKCFESDIKLVVVKNTLLGKALEKMNLADAELLVRCIAPYFLADGFVHLLGGSFGQSVGQCLYQ